MPHSGGSKKVPGASASKGPRDDNKSKQLESAVKSLEAAAKNLNKEISSIKSILNAMQKADK